MDDIEDENDDGSIQIQFDYQSKSNKNEKKLFEYDSKAMIHSNLQNLYTCATSHTSSYPPYQIRLETHPLFARIDGIYIVPGVTRENANAKPNLVGSWDKIWVNYKKSGSFHQYVQDIINLFQEASGTSEHMDVTIVMNVSILCDELFQVRDLESGQVIQGQTTFSSDVDTNTDTDADANDSSLKPQNVIHEVQFEKVFRMNLKTSQFHMHQSWQITDWDNLLNGNIWF